MSGLLSIDREPPSLAERLGRLARAERERVRYLIRPSEAPRLLYEWRFWARPTQLEPLDPEWGIWLLLAGRGWGKTRTGAEWVRWRIERGRAKTIGLFAPTLKDARETMLGCATVTPGEGLLNVFPQGATGELRPRWNEQKRWVTFPTHPGVVAYVYTAEEPEVRGPNLDTAWCDELAKWRYLQIIWDNLEMAIRKPGKSRPRICITTTPRPLRLLRELMADPLTRTTTGNTFANAGNVDPAWLRRMVAKYAGTRLGLQELLASILDDNPDALFKATQIQREWALASDVAARCVRIVISVDPAITQAAGSDETGIVVAGIDAAGRIYILADLSGKYSPEAWAKVVVKAFDDWKADRVVVERNAGGDLVAANLRANGRRNVPIGEVHAKRGKVTRAEPVASLYERGLVYHVGRFVAATDKDEGLEDQMTEWNPKLGGDSPDRLDALVWAVWDLAKLGEEEEEERQPALGLRELNEGFCAWDSLNPL